MSHDLRQESPGFIRGEVQNVNIHRYWGKTDDVSHDFHLAAYHCIDAALVVEALMRDRLWGSRVAPSSGLRNWIRFGSCIHDIGKFSILFSMKVPSIAETIYLPSFAGTMDDHLKRIVRNASSFYYHNLYGYFFINEQNLYGLSPSSEQWIRSAVGGHHGVPCIHDDIEPSSTPQSVNLYQTKLFNKHLAAYFEEDAKARQAFFEWARTSCLNRSDLENVPEVTEEALGIISLSDWIASNNVYFPFVNEPMDLDEYARMREPLVEAAIEEAGLRSHDVVASSWNEIFGYLGEPNPLQKLVASLPISGEPCMFIIESPTGDGKTEAALLLATRIIRIQNGGSIIFTCPTTSSTNDMYARLSRAGLAIYGQGVNVSLNHSRRHANPLWSSNAGTVFATDEHGEPMAGCNAWISGYRNRFSFADIAVSTIDQVMLNLLPVHHRPVRLLGLSRAVLILDEIHCCDPYMRAITKRAICKVHQHGGSVILLSATLANPIKEELIATFYENSPRYIIRVNDKRYPLVISVESQRARARKPKGAVQTKKIRYQVAYTEHMFPQEQHLLNAVERARSGQKVAIMCNLVSDSQSIYERILRIVSDDEATRHVLTHSRFITMHRNENDAAVANMARKGLPFGQGCIVVATQVLECSLDLDFDYMICQLCPLGLLFQRNGRLWRAFIEERIGAMGNVAECLVLMPENPSLKDSYGKHNLVYHDLPSMWRTARILDPNGDGSGRARPVKFPTAYRTFGNMVYDTRKMIKGVPAGLAEWAQNFDNDALMRALGNARCKMTAREVIINDRNFEELMTRVNVFTRELYLVLPPENDDECYRMIETEQRLQDPAFFDETIRRMVAQGKSVLHLAHRIRRRGHDEFLRDLELVTVSVSEHWFKDLEASIDNRHGLSYCVARPARDGSYRIPGNRYLYTYSRIYGFRKEEI